MSNVLVVVADSSRARLFKTDASADGLEEIQTLAHPEARLHDGDLTTDRSGRDSNNTSGSHGFGTGEEAKDGEAAHFAGLICSTLEESHNKGEFKRLYIVAAPAFLGLLRKCMSNGVKHLVEAELSKNVAAMDAKTIRSHLPERL